MTAMMHSADLSGCSRLAMLPEARIAAAFEAALISAGAHVVNRVGHAFPGGGLTCVLILQESHAVLHTWPESGLVNIDIFSCTSRLRAARAIEELARLFGALQIDTAARARAAGHAVVPER